MTLTKSSPVGVVSQAGYRPIVHRTKMNRHTGSSRKRFRNQSYVAVRVLIVATNNTSGARQWEEVQLWFSTAHVYTDDRSELGE